MQPTTDALRQALDADGSGAIDYSRPACMAELSASGMPVKGFKPADSVYGAYTRFEVFEQFAGCYVGGLASSVPCSSSLPSNQFQAVGLLTLPPAMALRKWLRPLFE